MKEQTDFEKNSDPKSVKTVTIRPPEFFTCGCPRCKNLAQEVGRKLDDEMLKVVGQEQLK